MHSKSRYPIDCGESSLPLNLKLPKGNSAFIVPRGTTAYFKRMAERVSTDDEELNATRVERG